MNRRYSPAMKRLWPALAAAGLVAGCSSGSDNPSTESSTSTPETVSVPEVCQTVADETPSSSHPDPSEWEVFDSMLADIEAPEGLLDDLREAAQALADDRTDLLDARSDMRDALTGLNEECKAAGSDALA